MGVVGPILVDGHRYQIPMATTEGALLASTNRGIRALIYGVQTGIFGDGITRAPVLRFTSAMKVVDLMEWFAVPDNFQIIKASFEVTSRFAVLVEVSAHPAGRLCFLRFKARTGDAMGMNMISLGVERALETLQSHFPDMEILALSGNVCTDKKDAAINWIKGRGKSVMAEALVPAAVLKDVLKTSARKLVELNVAKNLVGSALAGSIGGFNAHAANVVAAVFLATGQVIQEF
jgi:hydroxymethylglutaryl-CoA reductase (NADPH)